MSGPFCTGSAMACKPLLVQLANRNRVSVCRYKAGEPLGALARSVELPPCLLVRRFLEFIPEAHGLVSAVLQHSSLLQHDFSCLDKVLYEFGLMCLLCLAAVLYQTQALVHLTWPHGMMLSCLACRRGRMCCATQSYLRACHSRRWSMLSMRQPVTRLTYDRTMGSSRGLSGPSWPGCRLTLSKPHSRTPSALPRPTSCGVSLVCAPLLRNVTFAYMGQQP